MAQLLRPNLTVSWSCFSLLPKSFYLKAAIGAVCEMVQGNMNNEKVSNIRIVRKPYNSISYNWELWYVMNFDTDLLSDTALSSDLLTLIQDVTLMVISYVNIFTQQH